MNAALTSSLSSSASAGHGLRATAAEPSASVQITGLQLG